MKIDIPKILTDLADERPVFHSEADFQHAFAWQVHKSCIGLQPRLECPIKCLANKSCDIMFVHDGRVVMAIELKYPCQKLEWHDRGELFMLKPQSAQNFRRRDLLRDVERMEIFLGKDLAAKAATITLTNDPAFWEGTKNRNTEDAEFDVREGATLTGVLNWKKGTRNWKPEPAVNLRGTYEMVWRDYSQARGKFGQFRYLHIPVQLPKS